MFKRKVTVVTDNVDKLLVGLTKKCFTKTNRVYLYDVVTLKDGTFYPIYTSQPYRDYNWIDHHKGFPAQCNARYAAWIIKMRKLAKDLRL